MRRFTPVYGVLLAAATLLPLSVSAQGENRKLVDKNHQTILVDGHQVPLFAKLKASPNTKSTTSFINSKKSPKKSWYNESVSDEYLTEDFNKFTKGSESAPDTEPLCDDYNYFGYGVKWYIDPQYTETAGWCGSWVFQAGGNAYLNDPLGYIGAVINSPLGDYSGNLTITLRVKNSGKKSTTLMVNVLKGGYVDPSYADTDDGETSMHLNLNPNSGWKTVTLKVHNMSADNNGFLQLLAYGQCLVDYIHITREENYIAPPVMQSATNYTDSTFTANWQKVDMAANYWTWLYEPKETGTVERNWKADFESGVPADFKTNGKVQAGLGVDGSQALTLAEGDTLVTPYNFSTYKSMKFWMQTAGATSDEFAEEDSKINIDFLTVNGWINYGSFYSSYWTTPADLDMQEASQGLFNDIYFGVRIYPVDMPKGAYVVLDNFDIQAGKDRTLANASENQDYGIPYDTTKKTSFTFTDLGADKDYYYAVQSKYGNLRSTPRLYLAYGVAAPKVKPATDIDNRGSYTANWEPSVKATGYRVDNYGVVTAKEDGEYAVVDEDFSLINSDVTSATDPANPEQAGSSKYESLDGYTKTPGWTVSNMALAQGWVGAINDDYAKGSVKTPALYLANDDNFKLTIKAIGVAGSDLTVATGNETYLIQFDENGEINGTYTIPESGTAVTLRIYADNTFMLDNVKVSQDLKTGDHIYTTLSSTTLDGKDKTSTTFSNLYDYEYDEYGYAVTAIREQGPYYAESDLSDYVVVDLDGNTTAIKTANATTNASVVARYNVNGQKVSAAQRGVNILKMSDGTVRKVLVK